MITLLDKVRSVAADVFGVPAEKITESSSPENVETWDSTQHLTFILALEETFGIQLSPEEIERIHNVGDAALLVESRTQPS